MVNKLSALVVDDEESARELLLKLLDEMQCFSVIKSAKSASSAYGELEHFEPDIIFLDIRMPGKDGFQFINDLPERKNKPAIVFVTAYDEYALKAIKNRAFDYLLKPVSRKDLKQCISKYIENQDFRQPPEPPREHEKPARIRINIRSGTVFINPSAILYCKADGNYTTICTGEKTHLCSMNLGRVKELLPENFVRIGRSYIINEEYLVMLDRRESTIVLEHNGESVKVRIPRHHLKDLDML